MSENPLLPHAELRALLALTRRCASVEGTAATKASTRSTRGRYAANTGREAVLAATTLQLQQGDLLLTDPLDHVAMELASSRPTQGPGKPVLPPASSQGTSRLLLAAAMATALKQAGTDRVVLALTQPGSDDTSWQAALTWSQEHLLPLLLVATEPAGTTAFTPKAKTAPAAFEWGNVARLAAKYKLPVLTVDGEDAVAMYRTVQEAMLRARSGGGPAVLWAALPRPADLATRSRVHRPVNRLAQYLRARGIPVT